MRESGGGGGGWDVRKGGGGAFAEAGRRGGTGHEGGAGVDGAGARVVGEEVGLGDAEEGVHYAQPRQAAEHSVAVSPPPASACRAPFGRLVAGVAVAGVVQAMEGGQVVLLLRLALRAGVLHVPVCVEDRGVIVVHARVALG